MKELTPSTIKKIELSTGCPFLSKTKTSKKYVRQLFKTVFKGNSETDTHFSFAM
jgi:hypothetical protein